MAGLRARAVGARPTRRGCERAPSGRGGPGGLQRARAGPRRRRPAARPLVFGHERYSAPSPNGGQVQKRLRSPQVLSMRATAGQNLRLAHPRRREGGLLARVRAVPLGRGDRARRVRARGAAGSPPPSTRPSSTSRISSRIAIIASQKRSSSALRLALGGLDHQRARHRQRHRRRVEAVVHEPLRDVLDLDPGLLEAARRRG